MCRALVIRYICHHALPNNPTHTIQTRLCLPATVAPIPLPSTLAMPCERGSPRLAWPLTRSCFKLLMCLLVCLAASFFLSFFPSASSTSPRLAFEDHASRYYCYSNIPSHNSNDPSRCRARVRKGATEGNNSNARPQKAKPRNSYTHRRLCPQHRPTHPPNHQYHFRCVFVVVFTSAPPGPAP